VRLRSLVLCCSLLWLGGCSTLGYLNHTWQGQREVMRLSVPVTEILADHQADPALQARLELALQARRFASEQLKLPANASYTAYTALPRPYVLWNLFVTPPLSMEPQQHCYPLAGCIAYKGYFDQQLAEQAASQWREQGMDVYMAGIPAYSTLGWYDDPLLSSMLHWSDDYVAGLIFHELAHQQFYVRNDTAFNESFASFVEQQGLRQWRQERNLPSPDINIERQRREFVELMLQARADLTELFASQLPSDQQLAAKAARFQQLQSDYQHLRDQHWAGSPRYDGFFTEPLSNAHLLPFGLYDQWVPAFAMLFEQSGKDWPVFYSAVRQLGRLSPESREAALHALQLASEKL